MFKYSTGLLHKLCKYYEDICKAEIHPFELPYLVEHPESFRQRVSSLLSLREALINDPNLPPSEKETCLTRIDSSLRYSTILEICEKGYGPKDLIKAFFGGAVVGGLSGFIGRGKLDELIERIAREYDKKFLETFKMVMESE